VEQWLTLPRSCRVRGLNFGSEYWCVLFHTVPEFAYVVIKVGRGRLFFLRPYYGYADFDYVLTHQSVNRSVLLAWRSAVNRVVLTVGCVQQRWPVGCLQL
jgi:hypothetical protein